MARAFPVDIRESVRIYIAEYGYTQNEAAERCGVSVSTVQRIMRAHRRYGSLFQPKKLVIRAKIAPSAYEQLIAFVHNHPNHSLKELCAVWNEETNSNLHFSSFQRAMWRAGFPHKRKPRRVVV